MLSVVAFALVLWVIARIPLSGMKVLLGAVALIGIMMVVIQGFLYFSNETVLFYVFGYPFMAEGAIFGFTMAIKVLSVATVIPVLTRRNATTTPGSTAWEMASPINAIRRSTTKHPSTPSTAPISALPNSGSQ